MESVNCSIFCFLDR